MGQIPCQNIPKFKETLHLDSNYNKVSKPTLNGYTLTGNNNHLIVRCLDSKIDSSAFKIGIKEIDSYEIKTMENNCYFNDYHNNYNPFFSNNDYKLIVDSFLYPPKMIEDREIGMIRLTFYFNSAGNNIFCEQFATNTLLLKENHKQIEKLISFPKKSLKINKTLVSSFFDFSIHFNLYQDSTVSIKYNKIFVPFKIPKWTKEELTILKNFNISYVELKSKFYDFRIEQGGDVFEYLDSINGANWYNNFDSSMTMSGKNWNKFKKQNTKRDVKLYKLKGLYEKVQINTSTKNKDLIYLEFNKNGTLRTYKSNYRVGRLDGFTEYGIEKEYDQFGNLTKDNEDKTEKSVW